MGASDLRDEEGDIGGDYLRDYVLEPFLVIAAEEYREESLLLVFLEEMEEGGIDLEAQLMAEGEAGPGEGLPGLQVEVFPEGEQGQRSCKVAPCRLPDA